MKRLINVLLVAGYVIACAATLQSQDLVKRIAWWSDTVYTTSQKIALPNVGRAVKSVQVVNNGKVGGGDGILYAGLIYGIVKDTTARDSTGWARLARITPDDVDFLFDRCVADTVYLKSTDSVSVSIFVW